MRMTICLIGLAAALLATTGCESTRWNFLKPGGDKDMTAKPAGGAPTAAGLIAYLNENSKRVQSVRFDDLDIDASIATASGSQPVGLRGKLFAEKPRNFRLKATVIGKDEADIGSNLQEFWFWLARNPEPRLFYCSYKDLGDGRVPTMPLPIQPEWVMETLGLGNYGPADKYQLEIDKDGKTLRLIEKSRSPSGQPMRKVIVLNRKAVRAPQPQVLAYLLIDDTTGQEICSAHITMTKEVDVDRQRSVLLPYKMELRMPQQKMTMKMKMDGLEVNKNLPGTAFARPQMSGIEPFNLATGRGDSLQRTQGVQR